ncbi:MAG TPA: Spy/CpxP family protein refolding chaperone [Polyangia bacterium]|jgi:Spy/CpxP family protein refolding chaperone
MHPGFYGWWKSRHGGECGQGCGHEHAGPGGGWHGHHGHGGEGGPWEHARRWAGGGGEGGPGGEFGVRRPLRFLAYKLELDEKQVGELARILNELKTERAQAEVDGRRTTAAFADAVGGATFDESKAGEGATLRVQSAEKLKTAVQKALREIHAVLSDEQRQQLAYLIRTGVVTL